MKRSRRLARVEVSADGAGVVSHAGVALSRELAEYTGLVAGVGFPVDERIRRIVDLIPYEGWMPALESDGDIRDGA